MYKKTNATEIIRLSDGAVIAADETTAAFQDYLIWVADGNTPESAEPVPALTPLEQIRAIESSPTVADAMARGSRLVALDYALDRLQQKAAELGQPLTRDQAHAWAMENDTNYKTLYDAEQLIRPLRVLV